MSATFAAADLALLRDAVEVEIETAADEGGLAHRAIIWVVVDDRGRVLIRSYRGPTARWYREVTARSECRLHVGDRTLELRAVLAVDPDRIAACSEGLRFKYPGHGAMPGMLLEYLETTLELVPR